MASTTPKLPEGYDFRGKIALVTGANRPNGIGRATALAIAEQGAARVYVTARSGVDTWFADLQRDGVLEPIELDVTSIGSIRKAAARIPKLDILVNNSGTGKYAGDISSFLEDKEMPEAALREMEVNFIGPLRLLQEFLPQLKASKAGLVVNVGSIASRTFFAAIRTYGASKAALDYFTLGLAPELNSLGIRTALVLPGPVDTDLAKPFKDQGGGGMSFATPQSAGRQIVKEIERGTPVIFPDSTSQLFGKAYAAGTDGFAALPFAPSWFLSEKSIGDAAKASVPSAAPAQKA